MALKTPAGPAVEGVMPGEEVQPDLLWPPGDCLGEAFTEGFLISLMLFSIAPLNFG
jgi:hypothetical protein